MIQQANQNELLRMTSDFAAAKEQYKIRNGYRIGKTDRFSRTLYGVDTNGSSADRHFEGESRYHLGAERAEDADRNDISIGQGIDTKCVNILQNGFTVEPDTGDNDADDLLKQCWNEWANDPEQCDIQGEFDFATLSWLALRGQTVRGDIFGFPTNTGKVQVVENYRCKTPRGHLGENIVYGVELDSNRRRKGYWFTNDDIPVDIFTDVTQSRFIKARDNNGYKQVFHLYHPRRVTQTRGVTALAATLQAINMHDDITFAKLSQQVGVSSYMLIRERQMGFKMPAGVREQHYTEPDPCAPGQLRPVENISPMSMYTTFPGESMKPWSPNVPNPTFFDHQTQTLELIALSIDLPLLLFLMNTKDASFSSWRGSLEMAKKKFRRYQSWYASCWHKGFYNWKVRTWSDPSSRFAKPEVVALTRRDGLQLFKHSWGFPSWPYIQVREEVQSEALEQRNHLNSPRRIQIRHSRDWEDVSTEIVEDNAKLIIKAKLKSAEINGMFPEDEHPISWREVAGMATPEGTQVGLDTKPREVETNDEEESENENNSQQPE